MWELYYKQSWAPKNWCFWTVVLRVPWTARRSNQSLLKEISPEYSLEGLMLKLKLQYFGHLDAKNWLIEKAPNAGKDWRQEEKRSTEDEMVGWHHRLDEEEFEQPPGVGDGLGSLACCSAWGHKELDTTEWLNSLMGLVLDNRTGTHRTKVTSTSSVYLTYFIKNYAAEVQNSNISKSWLWHMHIDMQFKKKCRCETQMTEVAFYFCKS